MPTDDLNDETPDGFYVFVNDQIPAVAHNMRFVGQIFSGAAAGWSDPAFVEQYMRNEVDWIPFLPNAQVSPWLSFFNAGLVGDYAVEYHAELCRRELFPDRPSRLSALFAFGDRASCERAAQLYRWDLGTVRHFKLVPHPLTRVARVNMEIVSLARHAHRVAAVEKHAERALWEAYWAGRSEVELELPSPEPAERRRTKSGVIWEYLVDGVLALASSEEIRR